LYHGRPQEAIEHLEFFLQKRPNYPGVYANLGLALTKVGRASAAIPYFNQALRLQPDLVEVHNDLANALLSLGRTQEAIEHYELLMRNRPEYIEAYANAQWLIQRQIAPPMPSPPPEGHRTRPSQRPNRYRP